ncbi:hypothetical protein FRC12_010125 [Ceratobasidium sp. 428]|nr:hypothetical protein FRC12_010125 [Ceratobasidium sp. 428]
MWKLDPSQCSSLTLAYPIFPIAFDACLLPPPHQDELILKVNMQSIVGYSDDDRSDDEVKRPAQLKTLIYEYRFGFTSQCESHTQHRPSARLRAWHTLCSSFAWLLYVPRQEPRNREDADPSSESKPAVRSGKSKTGINASIIRRTTSAQPIKPIEQPDAPTLNDSNDQERAASAQQTPVEPNLQDLSLGPNSAATLDGSDLTQIRALLHPPPIPGVENFGIPPPSEDKVDPELEAKVSKFLALKKQGTHFNDILMRNKSFNNPHIYAKLVDFVDVDETGTNFPKNMWDPHDIQPEWYAEELGKPSSLNIAMPSH